MKKTNKAFSLIDVAITICILALLSSFIFPVWAQKDNRTKYLESVLELGEVAGAMEKHYLETGAYPVFDDWSAFASASENPLIMEEYIREIPQADKWGRPFAGQSNGEEYKLEGFSVSSRNQKQVSLYPDYSYKQGAKLTRKGQANM